MCNLSKFEALFVCLFVVYCYKPVFESWSKMLFTNQIAGLASRIKKLRSWVCVWLDIHRVNILVKPLCALLAMHAWKCPTLVAQLNSRLLMTPSAQEKFEILSRFCTCMEDVYSWGPQSYTFFSSAYVQLCPKCFKIIFQETVYWLLGLLF